MKFFKYFDSFGDILKFQLNYFLFKKRGKLIQGAPDISLHTIAVKKY